MSFAVAAAVCWAPLRDIMLGWVCCVEIPGEVGGYANDCGLGVSVWLLGGHGERVRSLVGGRGREGGRE